MNNNPDKSCTGVKYKLNKVVTKLHGCVGKLSPVIGNISRLSCVNTCVSSQDKCDKQKSNKKTISELNKGKLNLYCCKPKH